MIRVVFDTNIYISALHFQGSTPRSLLELAEKGTFKLLISKQIISELRGVLRVKFQYEISKINLFENQLINLAEVVEPKKKIYLVKADPDDNKILECAVEGKADFVVSGDKHLLSLREFSSIKIIKASQFLNLINKNP